MEIPKDDERPPEEIWKNTEDIAAWFQQVKENRAADGNESVTAPPLDQNETTRGLKERLRQG